MAHRLCGGRALSLDIDFYELLECDRTADDKVLKASYRRLAMQYHPDRNPGDTEAEARFKAINEAYDCLKDPQKRAAYDRFGKDGVNGQGGGAGAQGFGDFADIFESFFADAFQGGRQRGPQRGADLRYDMEITLDEAFHGKETEVTVDVSVRCESCDGSGAGADSEVKGCGTCRGHGKVRAQQGFFVVERPCPTCHGRGQVVSNPCRTCHGEGRHDKRQSLSVNVPPGVDNGTRIRMAGKGEAGAHGAPAGDLYVFIHVKEHGIFTREGTNLFTHVPISFTKAALGGTIELPGMDGEKLTLKVPEGIQSGKQIRHRGAGMPVLQGRGRGDLVVQIDVETPTRLSARQRELLCEFQETETGKECPQSEGFFAKIKDFFEDLT